MAHREMAFRLFNLWKRHQHEVLEGTNCNASYKFAYRNTLEKIQFLIDDTNNKPLDEFCQDLVNHTLDRLNVKGEEEDEAYNKGTKKALSDFLILMGKTPPVALSDCWYVI